VVVSKEVRMSADVGSTRALVALEAAQRWVARLVVALQDVEVAS
jgi:hypothetical protein